LARSASSAVAAHKLFCFQPDRIWASLANDISSGTRMDVVEFIIYGALSLWGPPMLLTAYLLSPIKVKQ
jgi:hypothetical protein